MKLSDICLCTLALTSLLLASCEKEDTVYAPALSVSSPTIVAASAGGTYSFTYSIDNPAEGGSLSCETSVDWISNINDSGLGAVSFTVSENAEDQREGKISLTYTSSYGTLSETVTVAQNAGSSEALNVQPYAVTADIEGGSYSFTYTLSDSASGGTLSCETNVDWISDIDCSVQGTVNFTVAKNDANAFRTGHIVLTCSYGTGVESGTVSVVQNYGHYGSGSGGIDISDVIGTYTAHGYYVDANTSTPTEMTWTTRIYEYDGDGEYELYIEALVPQLEGAYESNGGNSWSAGAFFRNSLITIPSQVTSAMTVISGISVYVGYTPCIQFSDEGEIYYNTHFPSTVFMPESYSGVWESDYGIILTGCMGTAVNSMAAALQAVYPTITLTKVSSDTKALTITPSVAHPIDEGLRLVPDMKW